MILYRAFTRKELLNMLHGNNVKINATIQGENTFRYDNGVDYMHFFKYAEHAFYYKNEKNVIAVMECIIPDIIIEQKGFGYYGGVKTKKNSELFGYYMPLPEYIIKRDNFDMKYIYDVNNWLHPKYIRKELNGSDNEIYREAIVKYKEMTECLQDTFGINMDSLPKEYDYSKGGHGYVYKK